MNADQHFKLFNKILSWAGPVAIILVILAVFNGWI